MSLKSFINRLVPQDEPDPSAPIITNFGGMDDHEMETVVSGGTKPRPRRERHSGFVAVLGAQPGDLLADGLLTGGVNPDAAPTGSEALRAFELPNGSHAAMQLLYDLEYADLILYTVTMTQGVNSDHLRWITRLQGKHTPVIVLLNGVTPPNEKYLASTLRMLKMSVTTPVVPVHTQDHAKSRQLLMETVYGLSPRLAAVMAMQTPLLRPVLAEYLLNKAVHTSMALESATEDDEALSSLAEEQVRLIRQITAVYGRGTRLTRREYMGLTSMVNAVTSYANDLVENVPAMKDARRARLANSVSTLLVGYITMIYHGETPPEVRKELLPHIWRLYRATGQMADG